MNKKNIGPVVFVVCDGLGKAPKNSGNAVEQAGMHFLHTLMQQYPAWFLAAHGEAVGLLPGFIGNSEVGHLTLGAGRIIKSSIARFHELIQSGKLAQHPHMQLLRTFATTGKTLHIIGLLSDGGVHSHELHLHSMLDYAVQNGIKKIVVHPILDGRDVAPKSGATYLNRLEQKLQALGVGKIGSIQGRFYAMDRNKNWDRTTAAYQMLCGTTPPQMNTWKHILDKAYTCGDFDEFVKPTLLDKQYAIQNDDAIIFVNVRPDRALQLTNILLNNQTQQQNNAPLRNFSFVITGYRYASELKNPVILEPNLIQETILDVIATKASERPIFLIAETEKYAHVTYFFKGMRNEQFKQETRIMIPSLKVRNYIEHPEMAAASITDQIEQLLQQHQNSFCVVNYANADMVGHSGNFKATVAACLTLEAQLIRLYELVVKKMNGTLLITADHGNAEEMLDANGNQKTSHTTNPVPFVIAAIGLEATKPYPPKDLSQSFGIAHIAPTLLKYMALQQPTAMVEPLAYKDVLPM